jgi:acyl dehydratase
MTTIAFSQLAAHAGREIGVSDWLAVSQEQINTFADATGDHEWIHIDVARAAAETPFKSTIAHGFLTLSLVSALVRSTVTVDGLRMAINYGLNRVRFVSPVPAGSRVRARVTMASVTAVDGGVQVTWAITVEREHGEKPCLVAEWLVRYYS